jgi:hypothetical protein
VAADPSLALGLSERHEQEVRRCLADPLQQGLLLPGGRLAEWRTFGPDDLEARVSLDQPARRLVRDALAAAEQEDPESLAGGLLREAQTSGLPSATMSAARSLISRRSGDCSVSIA